MLNCIRTALLGGVLAFSAVGIAQDDPKGVVLKSHIGLATFGAGSGNDCWGYVSPSGREYAIMGMNNMVAFVEVTDPSNPVILEKIPHGSSGWGDIKVYGHFAYAVTERAGTGIQVIDMSDIDNGVVTLVRTLDTISRAHNAVIDTENGYLYTVGSRGGTGTTVCLSLADPANPVQVGVDSITERYQHDAQVVTYTEGPLAGKQIWYGFSEGRGVDVYDVTDKDNPERLTRIEYPDIGYCHQGWLSEDKKYLYVNDEFDENQQGVATRSLVFNVEDPLNAFFVGTFTSGKNAIDHNQYVVDGFAFQSNYRSGLRIFDIHEKPEDPDQVGWYDTFAPNDDAGFDGAWSNYPFFPSGTVIVSDINDGLFVFDVSEAVTRTMATTGHEMTDGKLVNGDVDDLNEADGSGMRLGREGRDAKVSIVLKSSAFDQSPMGIQIDLTAFADRNDHTQLVHVMNWRTGRMEQVNRSKVNTKAVATSVALEGDLSDYVNPDTLEIRVEVSFEQAARARIDAVLTLDQFSVRVER